MNKKYCIIMSIELKVFNEILTFNI
jgi:hypothetical protein